MYFTDEEHKHNFFELLKMSASQTKDPQYLANFYIAAVPDIYDLFDVENLQGNSPLMSLMYYDEKLEKQIPNHPGLTSSTRQLLEIGVSLFNGHPCDLDYSFSSSFAKVIVQACEIRYRLTIPTL
jgi:hypothetical protein